MSDTKYLNDLAAVGVTASEEPVLLEAHRLVTGDRQNQYGPPDQDFARTAQMFNALFGDKLNSPIQPFEVAMFMILLKLSRQRHQMKRDNAVDIAGYAHCMQACVESSKPSSVK